MGTETNSKIYFKNLDALRFILAAIVLASHSMVGEVINNFFPHKIVERIVGVMTSGSLAVTFFFVLSGFLITFLMIEEKESNGSFSVKNFYVRRILRIWPLYFLVLLFSFVVYPLVKTHLGFIDKNPFNGYMQLFFLSNFDSIRIHHEGLVGIAPMMININWSVAIEEQFYFLWPLAFALFTRRQFFLFCIALLIGSCIFKLSYSEDDAILYYHTFSVISSMAIGALGAQLAFYNKTFIAFLNDASRNLIIFLYAVGFLILTFPEIFRELGLNRSLVVVIQATFFCFILLEQNFCNRSLFKLQRAKSLSSLGRYTYGLYMLNAVGIQAAIISLRYLSLNPEDSPYARLVYVLISGIVSFILATLSFHYYERFFLEKRKYFYQQPMKSPST